jgi:hypothetical protein
LLAFSARAGQDAIALAPGQRVERHVPCAGGVLHHRDLVRVAVEQRRDRAVDGFQSFSGGVGRFVAAHARLELEVPDGRVEDDLRRQCTARVVEVRDVCATGRLAPSTLDVEGHHPRTALAQVGERP